MRPAYKARIAASKAGIESDVRALVPNAKRQGLKPWEFVALVRRVLNVTISTEWARDLLGEKARPPRCAPAPSNPSKPGA